MPSRAELWFKERKQLALTASDSVVRALVPANKPGVYMLMSMHEPLYIDRSDNCIKYA